MPLALNFVYKVDCSMGMATTSRLQHRKMLTKIIIIYEHLLGLKTFKPLFFFLSE